MGILKVATLVVVVASTGCIGLMDEPWRPRGEGKLLLWADGEGVSEMGQVLNGLVATGKGTPDAENPYWNTRQSQMAHKFPELHIWNANSSKGGQK